MRHKFLSGLPLLEDALSPASGFRIKTESHLEWDIIGYRSRGKPVMKLTMRRAADRFTSPTTLRGDAPFLGATVQQWDDAIVGNMQQTLVQVKLHAELGPKRDASSAITSDVASYAGPRLASQK